MVEIGFCTWTCFSDLGADLDRLQAEIGERADIDVIHFGMAADLLVGGDELGAVLVGELAAGRLEDVGADRHLVADVLVRLRVLVRDRAGADHSDSHGTPILAAGAPCTIGIVYLL